MTTGLAIVFFGWAGVFYEVILLIFGKSSADSFMDNVMDTFGAI